MPPATKNPAALILLRPFATFFRRESASGVVLLATAVIALVWASSPLSEQYFALWQTPLTVEVGGVGLSKPLLLWINDGLMAVFFFVVGLEIKREMLVGELASPKRAALSIAAAFGGMVVPAGIYALLNAGGEGEAGWGIPMATDIAFALGVLALLGSRVPTAIKVFVTAIAIVDDIGAVLVIAIFYTGDLSLVALAIAGGVLVAMVALNRFGVFHLVPYAILGTILWFAVLKSGVHATIAGILAAATIPAKTRIDAPAYLRKARLLLDEFEEDLAPGVCEPTADQRDAVRSLEDISEKIQSPLARLEHALHPLVAFVVMPVFALANAGVSFGDVDAAAALVSPVALGTVLGLVVGKQIGIVVASWIVVRTGLATLPYGVSWAQVWGVGLLAGIGFTMSLFIASLAFADGALLAAAKLGILTGSLVSGLAGALLLAKVGRRPPSQNPLSPSDPPALPSPSSL